MPSATSTKGVSCSIAGAGKVTLIGNNCPASRVGRRVDCKGGRVDRQNDRPPAVWLPNNSYCLASSTHSSPAEFPGLQGTPAARRRLPRRSPTTVVSPDGQYPGSCSGDSVDRQNDGAPVLCAVTCLLAVLTYGEALSDRNVSYRIVSLMAVSCHH